MKIRKLILPLLLLSVILIAWQKPDEWIKAGSEPKKYEMGPAKGTGPNKKNVYSIKSVDSTIGKEGFGTYMKWRVPGEYLKKRVRVTAYMRSADIKNWAGLWFRIDGNGKDAEGNSKTLGFDNMQDRPVKGNTDWKKYDVVLDVPEDTRGIAYGVLLSGTGQVWFEELTLEVVDKSVKTTNMMTDDDE